MAKSILGNGNTKRGYLIGTDSMHLPPTITQDSAKEQYILCEECEDYFSVLETYYCQRVHNRLWDVRYEAQFPLQKSPGGIDWKACDQVDSRIIRLFLYSIIWRCSIAESEEFANFKLPPSEDEILRVALLASKNRKQVDLLTHLTTDPTIPLLPLVLLTTDTFVNRTDNYIMVYPSTNEPYILILNEYVLIFSFSNNPKQNDFSILNNNDNSKFKICFLPFESWEHHRNVTFGILAQKTNSNLKESEKTYYK